MTLTTRVFHHRRPVIRPSLSGPEQHALDEVEELYSPYGILRLFTTYFRSGPGAGMHVGHGQYFDFDYVVSRMLGVPGLTTPYGSQVYGGGKGLDMFDMYVSSMGEGVERLLGSLAVFDAYQHLRFGTWRDLTQQGLTCLHPADCPIFSESQYADPHFEFDRWDEDSRLGWIPGRRLLSGERVYVPAQLVLFIYHRPEDEPRIGLAPSGGLASHVSADAATVHAVCEVVERDALNLRWHARVPLDRVVVDTTTGDRAVDTALAALATTVNTPGLYHHNLDLEEFPCLTVLGFDRWLSRLSYHAGGGVGPNLLATLRSALSEYAQAERSIRVAQLTRNWQFGPAFDAMFGIREEATAAEFARYVQAIAYYGYPRNYATARWYFEDGAEVPLSELVARDARYEADPYTRMSGALRRHQLDPIMFDFTPRGLRHLRLIKAFIPELTQPYPQTAPALGHPRFVEMARASGHPGAAAGAADLVTDPLPYP